MMTQAQLATASLNDIVFDGRNKEYGAYELRALYDRNVMRALAWASLVLLLLIAFPLIARLVEDRFPALPKVINDGKVTLIDVVPDVPTVIAPPVTPPPPVQQQAAAPAPTMRFTPPVVTKDNQANGDPVPEQRELIDTQVSTVTITGPGETPLIPVEAPAGKATGGIVENKPYTYVEQMPEMPGGGGMAAVVAAIQKAVRYPGIALRNGVEGRVFASFTVNAAGDIIDVKIVKGLGSGIDEETIRAIKTLPKFIPGKQNGREVSVSFTVPVTYKIQ
jgi:protein TonB